MSGLRKFVRRVIDHAGAWMVGALLTFVAGLAPPDWTYRILSFLGLENAWPGSIDVRLLPVAVGVAIILADYFLRIRRPPPPPSPPIQFGLMILFAKRNGNMGVKTIRQVTLRSGELDRGFLQAGLPQIALMNGCDIRNGTQFRAFWRGQRTWPAADALERGLENFDLLIAVDCDLAHVTVQAAEQIASEVIADQPP